MHLVVLRRNDVELPENLPPALLPYVPLHSDEPFAADLPPGSTLRHGVSPPHVSSVTWIVKQKMFIMLERGHFPQGYCRVPIKQGHPLTYPRPPTERDATCLVPYKQSTVLTSTDTLKCKGYLLLIFVSYEKKNVVYNFSRSLCSSNHSSLQPLQVMQPSSSRQVPLHNRHNLQQDYQRPSSRQYSSRGPCSSTVPSSGQLTLTQNPLPRVVCLLQELNQLLLTLNINQSLQMG